MTLCTRSLVSSETRSGRLITLDTVPTDTPACRATSLIPTIRTMFSSKGLSAPPDRNVLNGSEVSPLKQFTRPRRTRGRPHPGPGAASRAAAGPGGCTAWLPRDASTD